MTLSDKFDDWADGKSDDVALNLKQTLVSVEAGDRPVIFPPTYASIGYNINELVDGTKVVTIDSVGSQANRLEPIFKEEPYSALVPQIEIEIPIKPKDGDPYTIKRSLLDLAHRSADATVYASPTLGSDIKKAFHALKTANNAMPLCRLAPTSLVFGVWDSRGGSAEKRPRIVRSIIRAWDVEPLHAAAQFNSIRKTLDEEQWGELEKEAKAKNKKLSDVGLDDAPATFRKADKIPEYKDGSPNPERRTLGGVLARGPIERDVTVNLVALRRYEGGNEEETRNIRRYLLSLALIAATADFELYLREGCHLRFAGEDQWHAVPRRGDPVSVDLISAEVARSIMEYAEAAVQPFKTNWPEELTHKFDLAAAKKLIATAEVEEEGGA
jgi:CRISPR-associated protein Csb1